MQTFNQKKKKKEKKPRNISTNQGITLDKIRETQL